MLEYFPYKCVQIFDMANNVIRYVHAVQQIRHHAARRLGNVHARRPILEVLVIAREGNIVAITEYRTVTQLERRISVFVNNSTRTKVDLAQVCQ